MLIPTESHQRVRRSVAEAEAAYVASVAKFATSRKPARRGRRSRADKKRDRDRAQTLRLPFGFQNQAWEALKAEMRPGDELWEFCTARSSWDQLMGVAGYELRRGDVVICTVVVKCN